MDNQIDPTTGTVKLRALFPNEDNSLFPSQFVNVRLLVRTERGVTLVPTGAIQATTFRAPLCTWCRPTRRSPCGYLAGHSR